MKRNLENELWGKTLLSLYRHLETMANSIDNLIKRIGINSAFNHTVYNSTILDANKIIELTERKIKIINLKVLTEKALNGLSEKHLKILMLYYVDGLNYKKIQEVLNITQRTFFRRKEIAIAHFSNKLCEQGFDSKKLFNYLKNENWVRNTYFQIINSTANYYNNSCKPSNNFKLLKLVLNDFNEVCSNNYSFF